MLKHIGLQILEDDLDLFYTDILQGKQTFSFILKQEDALDIFNLDDTARVCYLEIGKVKFELFLYPKTNASNFNHTCLEVRDAQDILHRAMENNYWTHTKVSCGIETYFIKDKAGNMFELKPKLQ